MDGRGKACLEDFMQGCDTTCSFSDAHTRLYTLLCSFQPLVRLLQELGLKWAYLPGNHEGDCKQVSRTGDRSLDLCHSARVYCPLPLRRIDRLHTHQNSSGWCGASLATSSRPTRPHSTTTSGWSTKTCPGVPCTYKSPFVSSRCNLDEYSSPISHAAPGRCLTRRSARRRTRCRY